MHCISLRLVDLLACLLIVIHHIVGRPHHSCSRTALPRPEALRLLEITHIGCAGYPSLWIYKEFPKRCVAVQIQNGYEVTAVEFLRSERLNVLVIIIQKNM